RLSTGLPIPQILPHRALGSSPRRGAVERPVPSVATSSDDLGVESTAKPPSEDAHATETSWRSPTPRKRAQRPMHTPKATPSPKLKEAKHGEREEAEAKHDAVPQQQQADKPNPPPPSPKPSPNGSRKKSDSEPTGIPVTNQNTLREYNIQAAKGRFV